PCVPLQQADLKGIAEIQLKSLARRLNDKGIKLNWEEQTALYLANKGYDKVYGARPLKRVIDHDLGNMLAQALIDEKIKPGHQVRLLLEGNQIKFKTDARGDASV
ncbi:MAG: type VI secretion system ATPase TssH, partial [Parachlamydia sp.]|nr:type VI secretion system ATPase TssH [Parachlamydia sp.]